MKNTIEYKIKQLVIVLCLISVFTLGLHAKQVQQIGTALNSWGEGLRLDYVAQYQAATDCDKAKQINLQQNAYLQQLQSGQVSTMTIKKTFEDYASLVSDVVTHAQMSPSMDQLIVPNMQAGDRGGLKDGSIGDNIDNYVNEVREKCMACGIIDPQSRKQFVSLLQSNLLQVKGDLMFHDDSKRVAHLVAQFGSVSASVVVLEAYGRTYQSELGSTQMNPTDYLRAMVCALVKSVDVSADLKLSADVVMATSAAKGSVESILKRLPNVAMQVDQVMSALQSNGEIKKGIASEFKQGIVEIQKMFDSSDNADAPKTIWEIYGFEILSQLRQYNSLLRTSVAKRVISNGERMSMELKKSEVVRYLSTPLTVHVQRNYNVNGCVVGRMWVGDKFVGYTVERPAVANINCLSSIPEGRYFGSMIVDNNGTATGVRNVKVRINGVTERSGIRVDIANSVEQLSGCIAIGNTIDESKCWVSNSETGFANLVSEILIQQPDLQYQDGNVDIVFRIDH